mgnify:CR=1 FL=1
MGFMRAVLLANTSALTRRPLSDRTFGMSANHGSVGVYHAACRTSLAVPYTHLKLPTTYPM